MKTCSNILSSVHFSRSSMELILSFKEWKGSTVVVKSENLVDLVFETEKLFP